MARTISSRASVAIVLAGLLLMLLGPPRDADAGSRASCDRRGSDTLARSSAARVFVANDGVTVGCLYERGVGVDLDLFDDVSDPGPHHISFAGPYVGYETITSSSSGSSSGIRVFNLRTGRQAHALTRTLSGGFVGGPFPGESSQDLRDLTVTSHGRVVWIDEVVPYVRCPTPSPYACQESARTEVRLIGPGGYRVLDSGTDIAKTSLHRRGMSVYWFRGGQRRSARVG